MAVYSWVISLSRSLLWLDDTRFRIRVSLALLPEFALRVKTALVAGSKRVWMALLGEQTRKEYGKHRVGDGNRDRSRNETILVLGCVQKEDIQTAVPVLQTGETEEHLRRHSFWGRLLIAWVVDNGLHRPAEAAESVVSYVKLALVPTAPLCKP